MEKIIISIIGLVVLGGGCSTNDDTCIIDTQCVTACGETPMSSGCDPCPDGTFDVMTCPDDGGTGDGGDASDTGMEDAADTSVGPIECGDTTCGADEYCVQPCCGGAAPMCQPRQEDGTCPPGTNEYSPCYGGSGDCAPEPCEPPPAFCAPDDECTSDGCPAVDCYGGYWDEATRTYNCMCA
jgi:hypothetical protein